nr:transposase [Desulfurella sp.]
MESIPGVGRVLSSTIMGFLPEIKDISKKQAFSLIGIAPFSKESGKVKKKGKITGGRFQVRKALYMANISAIKSNKQIKEFYLKLKSKDKPGRVCIVACMNKLMRIIHACLRNNTFWEEDYVTKQSVA